MRIIIAAVSRARRGVEQALYESFAKRIVMDLTLAEVEEHRPLPVAERVRAEGSLLLKRIPDDAVLVALDSRGKTLTSEDFAARIGAWRDDGVGTLAFAIGGADGLGAQVIERAVLSLSLGAMTWPHLLARTMLAEQLYRAEAILAGHPYHRPGPPP